MSKTRKKKLTLDLGSLPGKVNTYKTILANTIAYRKEWTDSLKEMIIDHLNYINDSTGLNAQVHVKDSIENMEAVLLDLGRVYSGMMEVIDSSDVKKNILKTQGGLVYQQLFNGKIMVMIIYPYIEGYGEPRPPKNVEILRPEELKPGFIIRHFEEFVKDLTEWEDYDDDQPKQPLIGYNQPIGFGNNKILDDEGDEVIN